MELFSVLNMALYCLGWRVSTSLPLLSSQLRLLYFDPSPRPKNAIPR